MAEHLNLRHARRQEIRPKRGWQTDRELERVRRHVPAAGLTLDAIGTLEAAIKPDSDPDIVELHQKLQELADVALELEELRSMIAVLEFHIQDERSTQRLRRPNLN